MLHLARGTCIVRQDITLRGASATKGDLMTMETQHAPRPAEVGHAYLDRLERLAEVLARHGLRARLTTPAGRVPRPHVVNPAAAAMGHDHSARASQDRA